MFDGFKMRINIIKLLLNNLFVIFSLLSCAKQERISLNNDLSLFAFIIADNNLDDHAEYIEKNLVKGLKGCPVGTELFLYLDRYDEEPTLRHIVLSESGKVKYKTLLYYDEQYSTSPQVFKEVLSTMINKSSGKRYGLIYWSHGNGWLPGLNPDMNSTTATRALGADGIYSMNINDFGNILLDTKTPCFVVLDACYMGAVEVAYSLRNSSDYLIASSAETLGICFPYHLILPDLVKGNRESLSRSLDTYLDFCYSDYYGDGTISGIASLVDCSQMDSLASAFRSVIKQYPAAVNIDGIQTFELSNPHQYYDLGDYVQSICGGTPEFDAFDHQLKRTVINKVCTPSVYTESRGKEDMLTIDRFSGLSTYIIGSSSYNDYVYSMTEWYIDCYGN